MAVTEPDAHLLETFAKLWGVMVVPRGTPAPLAAKPWACARVHEGDPEEHALLHEVTRCPTVEVLGT